MCAEPKQQTSVSTPRVSVVIPTCGRPAMLLRAIRTVLDQTMHDIELIVVIDGEDPATLEALATVGDPRLRWIAHDRKRGAGQTRDTGADAARGNWVAFLDDDDEWLPRKLERQLASAPVEPAVLMTLSRVVTPGGDFIRPADPYTGQEPIDEWLFDRRTWLRGAGFLQTSSLMMPRMMFDQLRFRDTRQHEEWELVLRAVKQLGYRLITVPEPLVIHYLGDPRASLSKTYTWGRSLEWIDGLGDLVTARARSGFSLTVVGRSAANNREWSALAPLLRHAFAHGRPTARQIFAFTLAWAAPMRLRRRLRRMLQGERSKI